MNMYRMTRDIGEWIALILFFVVPAIILGAGPRACTEHCSNMETSAETEQHKMETEERRRVNYDPNKCMDQMYNRDNYRMISCTHAYHRMEVVTDLSGEETTILCKCDLSKPVKMPKDLREESTPPPWGRD